MPPVGWGTFEKELPLILSGTEFTLRVPDPTCAVDEDIVGVASLKLRVDGPCAIAILSCPGHSSAKYWMTILGETVVP